MAQLTQSLANLWSCLIPIIHIKPYVWTIIGDFKPRLSYLGINPTTEWIAALLWAILDASFFPVLLSLEPIIEPLLNLSPRARNWLDKSVYVWAVAILLYKIGWIHASSSCSDVDWESDVDWDSVAPKEAACVMSAIILTMISAMGAIMVGGLAVDFLTDGIRFGPLRGVLSAGLGLMVICLCLYPSITQYYGRSFDSR